MAVPTYDDLNSALHAVAVAFDIPGARRECANELLRLRLARTTWIGGREIELRDKIDAVLDECLPGWGKDYTGPAPTHAGQRHG